MLLNESMNSDELLISFNKKISPDETSPTIIFMNDYALADSFGYWELRLPLLFIKSLDIMFYSLSLSFVFNDK